MIETMPKPMKDYRLWGTGLALLAILYSLTNPKEIQPVRVYNLIAIVDITRSMNAEDYELNGKPVSRLDYIKRSLRELMLQLPCQSKLGLGIFTDRRSTLLFEPIEVCSGYNELDKAIAALDWRMAWAADSRIANGLLSTLEMLQKHDEAILFMTDGHEAPPINPAYRTDFTAIRGKSHGLIVGVGGDQPVPIPKFNNKGERIGVYQPDDVPHRSSFGVSDLNPEKIEGYDARNAPFGSDAVIGNEHQSTLNESYLAQLSLETGFDYVRLSESQALLARLEVSNKYQVEKNISNDIRWQFTIFAVILIFISRV
jgi:mxaL protein